MLIQTELLFWMAHFVRGKYSKGMSFMGGLVWGFLRDCSTL